MASYRYQCLDCGKTYIGVELVGGMTCNCKPPKKIDGLKLRDVVIVRKPLSAELLTELSVKEAAAMREKLCKDLGINNKSHKSHGSNFSSNQTLVKLIEDITTPVTGGLIVEVRAKIIKAYGYDYVTGEMV